jgi:hypothetical protein
MMAPPVESFGVQLWLLWARWRVGRRVVLRVGSPVGPRCFIGMIPFRPQSGARY